MLDVVGVLRIAAGDTKRMQNELKTNTTGTVTTIHVQEGATVETGTILITVVAPEA
jgi:pyruvate/2-oxoglutarate dehydrogenase complex dihydrolipoamide acyltransferase (E2) component